MGRRVVSLLPSTTEIVAALGHTDVLVGRSHECDFPPEVRELPVVSRPRREPVGTSGQIHRSVQELLSQVLSIYVVDPAALRAADPDLILTQDLCDVCAVPEEAVREAAREHLGGDVEVLTSSPLRLDDVERDVRRIADALGDPGAGRALVGRLRERMDSLRKTVAGRPRVRTLLLEWADPLIAGGNWAPELLEIAGCEPVLGAPGRHSPEVTLEEVRAADPDLILLAPCGFDLERTRDERPVLWSRDGWRQLRAVRGGRVALADGSAYFNRPGPRLVESAAIVAALAHGVGPGLALRGTGWEWVRDQ